ncbi:MAG: hypothetical protein ACRDKL_02870 [Solirubrobacteraceae bacterium]
MPKRTLAALAAVSAALALGAGVASASMMSSKLAANLSGMGDHGTVQLDVSKGKVCWKFDLPMVKRVTGASIHAHAKGAKLLELGMHYSQTGCERASAMTLQHLEAKPGSYWVWVDVKGHMDELRGKLHAGSTKMM